MKRFPALAFLMPPIILFSSPTSLHHNFRPLPHPLVVVGWQRGWASQSKEREIEEENNLIRVFSYLNFISLKCKYYICTWTAS